MKRSILLALSLLFSIPLAIAETPATPNSAAAPASSTPNPMTHTSSATAASSTAQVAAPAVDKSKLSYSIGVDLGENFKNQGIDVDPEMLIKGMKDAAGSGKLMFTKEEMANTLIAFQKQLIAKQQSTFNAAASKNEQEGKAYIEANKTKPGVVTTASGLQYKVVNQGSGQHPADTDVVTVDYSGSFINGQVFDSSYKRGKPVSFPVTEVIPGWVEAIKLMQPGATYEVVVPSNLAYGDRGLGNVIGPKQTLLFKIHLISVKPATQSAT